MPPGTTGLFLAGRSTLEPGFRQTVQTEGRGAGIVAAVVESGVLTLRIDGPGRLVRAANTSALAEEATPIGSPFTLAAGDAVFYPDQGSWVVTNEGTEPVVDLWLLLLPPTQPPTPDPTDTGASSAVIMHALPYRDADPTAPMADLPSGQITLTVRHLTFGPGALLPAAPAGAIEFVAHESGGAGGLELTATGEIRNTGAGPSVAYAVMLASSAQPAATPAAPASPLAATGPVAFLWQTRGGPDLPLSVPSFLALDPRGNLWVVDGRNSRFQIFAPDGTFLETWGNPGDGDGQFDFLKTNGGRSAASPSTRPGTSSSSTATTSGSSASTRTVSSLVPGAARGTGTGSSARRSRLPSAATAASM